MGQWVLWLESIKHGDLPTVGGTLSLGQSFLALPLILLVFCCTSILPVGLSLLFPVQAKKWLATMKSWLERNTRLLTMVMLLIFGTLFLWKGLGNLLA